MAELRKIVDELVELTSTDAEAHLAAVRAAACIPHDLSHSTTDLGEPDRQTARADSLGDVSIVEFQSQQDAIRKHAVRGAKAYLGGFCGNAYSSFLWHRLGHYRAPSVLPPFARTLWLSCKRQHWSAKLACLLLIATWLIALGMATLPRADSALSIGILLLLILVTGALVGIGAVPILFGVAAVIWNVVSICRLQPKEAWRAITRTLSIVIIIALAGAFTGVAYWGLAFLGVFEKRTSITSAVVASTLTVLACSAHILVLLVGIRTLGRLHAPLGDGQKPSHGQIGPSKAHRAFAAIVGSTVETAFAVAVFEVKAQFSTSHSWFSRQTAKELPLPWSRLWQPVVICAFAGAWGVITGFALFFLWASEAKHGRENPWAIWRFWIALIIAGIAAWVVEFFRDMIRYGKAEGNLPVTFLTLTVIELFILAAHEFPEKYSAFWNNEANTVVASSPHQVQPPVSHIRAVIPFAETTRTHEARSALDPQVNPNVFAHDDRAVVTLATFAVAWIAVGAIVAGSLSIAAYRISENTTGKILIGVRQGILAGCILAPVAVFASVAIVRISNEAVRIFNNADWWQSYKIPDDAELVQVVALLSVWWFGQLVWLNPWAWSATVITVLAIATLARRFRLLFFVTCALGTTVLAFVAGGLLFNTLVGLDRLMFAALSSAIVWGAPAIVLGLLVPLLRKSSEFARTWFFLALGVAILLCVLTLVRLRMPGVFLPAGFSLLWLIVPAVILLYACFVIYRELRVVDHWPFMALLAGTLACGSTGLLQNFTSVAVMARIHMANEELRTHLAASTSPTEIKLYPHLRKEMYRIEYAPIHAWSAKAAYAEQLLDEVSARIANVKSTFAKPAQYVSGENGILGNPNTEFITTISLNELRTLQRQLQLQRRVFRQMASWDDEATIQQFELALSGSIAFWVTIGLLTAWRRLDQNKIAQGTAIVSDYAAISV